MGLFDFFGRKPDTRHDPGPVEEDLDEPRCHHYMLAHYALRGAAFDDPLACLGILASPDAQRFLSHLLQSVSEHCKEREPRPDFSAERLAVHKVRVGRYPCAVVEMPRPRATTEAFFVAAVLLADPKGGMSESEEIELRYFILERGFVLGGPPRTVLCEWTSEGKHVNYGNGPEARLELFVRAVEEMVSKS